MTQGGPYQTQAEDCLQKARNSNKEADKWSWLVLAENCFRLSDLRKSGIPERGNAESEFRNMRQSPSKSDGEFD